MSEMKNRKVIDEIAACLDIPDSAYEKAEARYKDLGDWFSRRESHCYAFDPHIYPQGSFRLGTVVRADEFDLDMGCRLRSGVSKATHSQEALKRLVQLDLEAYRLARGIENELEEKNRCWRLRYKDELEFHIDAVPSIPEGFERQEFMKTAMVSYGIDGNIARGIVQHAGAITDNRMPNYKQLSQDWKVSNSEGYALWFEAQMKLGTEVMTRRAMEVKAAKIDDLPANRWRSPLQRAIQILKCHRDQMFAENVDSKPISVILTTLAADAYQGEGTVAEALDGVLSRMGGLVRANRPRVPNPVNPVEDFADKWYDPEHKDLRLEENFWLWLHQAKVDLEVLQSSGDANFIREQALTKYGARLNSDAVERLGIIAWAVEVPKVHVISEAPAKPWRRG